MSAPAGFEVLRRAASTSILAAGRLGAGLVARDGDFATMRKRDDSPGMDDGAITGIVLGTVLGVGLLIFCIYPCIIRQVKKRRARKNGDEPPFDPEAAMVEGPGGYAVPVPIGVRRLSSSDSYHHTGQTSRAAPDVTDRDVAWSSREGSQFHPHDGQSQHPTATSADGRTSDRAFPAIYDPSLTEDPTLRHTESFPLYDREFFPESTPDDQPGVLKGTNADYYSQSIPSSAFGMIPESSQDAAQHAEIRSSRSLSRSSSLRYNMKQMFVNRKATRDRTMSSQASSDEYSGSSGLPQLVGGTQLPRIITDEDATTSPTELSPVTTHGPPLPRSAPPPPVSLQPAPTRSPPEAQVKTPPHSPLPSHFKGSPSPPTHPAPGTVNPMDIMPASTQSEMWHRTEHQLFTYEKSQSPPASTRPPDIAELTPLETSPSPTSEALPNPTHFVQCPTPTTNPEVSVDSVETDVAMTDIPASQKYLTPMLAAGRHPSSASEISSPLPGPASTVPSSQNTPSTQIDSPSPASLDTSSDFRHSTSPQAGTSISSPRIGGSYRCEEPGCSQTFDQPHKLKHHQRYHDKLHRCHYPGCDKGFGTKTHLQRHINDRHEKKKKYHCAIQGCDYSRAGGKAFPRKDNWKRHMTKIHIMDQQNLPEPEEVDQEMSGT